MKPVPDFENDSTLTSRQKQRRREYYRDREINIAKTSVWQKANRDRVRRNQAKQRSLRREEIRIYHSEWIKNHPEAKRANKKLDSFRLAVKRRMRRIKLEVIAAYGNYCVCCGEDRLEFLGIDHINNDGAEHRRQIRTNSGSDFYWWLKVNGFPKEGLQILCHNCNGAKGYYGICPHEVESKRLLGIPVTIPEVRRPRLAKKATGAVV